MLISARNAVVVAGLVIAACSPDVEPLCVPGESRACACSSGATGAQICHDDGARFEACTCGIEDAGGAAFDAAGPGDAGLDASSFDSGADSGGIVDAAIDVPRDAFSWACSVVPQAGCAAGYACRLSHVDGRTPGNGPPECVPAGIRPERDTGCTRWSGVPESPPDDCAPGLFCWTSCRRYCVPGGDPCPPVMGTPFECLSGPGTQLDPNPIGVGVCQIAL